MDALCDNFWNSSISWDTEDPHLSPCFQKTVLVWIPCFFLWLFCPFEIYYLATSKDKHIPWSWVNISKIIFSIALVVEQLLVLFYYIHLGDSEDVSVVDYLAPSFLLISFLMQLAFILLEKRKGLQRSGYLFLFWLLILICGLIGYISHISYVVDGDGQSDSTEFILFMIYYPMVIVMMLLFCFADKRPTVLVHPRGKNSSPELDASYPNFLTFAWLTKLVWRGYRKPLVQEDLWDLSYECSSRKIVKDWDRNWNKSVEKLGKAKSEARPSPKSDDREQISILPVLVRTFGREFFFGSFLKVIHDLLLFASPLFLNLLINFIEDSEEYEWRGYLYSVGLFASLQLESFTISQYFVRMFAVGLKVRTAIISAVYRKALVISNAARKDFTVGEIVNLMSVDAQRFMDLIPYLNMLWSAPLQILIALVLLWVVLGPSVLAGFFVIVLLIPVNGFIANRMKAYQITQMKEKDNRVKLMSEILNGMKVLKLYAWEPSFEEQVFGIRKKEVKVLKKSAYLGALTAFVWTTTPFLMTFFMFLTYVMTGDDHVLTPDKVFVSIALLNIVRMPLNVLPFLIVGLVQTSVSLKRMNKFLNANELDPDAVTKKDLQKLNGVPIEIKSGNFSWDGKTDESTLKDINLEIKEGSLVAIVGSVGVGKSSLCSAILGEMEKLSGSVTISNSISYVSQQAWIQNATLESNILFGCKKDPNFYKRVIEACALKDDLSILPGGDQTEIGEKGINLSGGQKQRVSLARAVYGNSDVILLDDPLSAVDAHVGKHIFEMVIGPHGIMKDKTRVLITHNIIYLPKMDNIIVMKDGRITDRGTYQELIHKEGEFRDFLLEHLSEEDEKAADLEEFNDIMTDLHKTPGNPKFTRQISQISKTSRDSQRNELRRRDSKISNGSVRKPDKDLPHKKNEVAGKKLIESESAETGRVSYKVYGYYIKTVGLIATIFTVLFYVLAQACMVGSNVVLTIWSEDEDGDDSEVRNKYLTIYAAFGISQSLFVLVALLGFARAAVIGSRVLHNNMLTNIVRLPLTFFDITPIGRVLNRFSKDIDTIDLLLPMNFRSWIQCFIVTIATLAVIIAVTPMFIVVMVPTLVVYYFVQLLYVTSSRQMKRIESVTRSPIYSHFGETIQGSATIRAYNKNKEFISDSEHKVDYNQVSYYPSIIANRWLSLRLEFLGNVLTFFASLLAVIQKGDVNAGQAGLSITYALSVTVILNWLVRVTSNVETNIVSVERVKEYTETTREAAWDVPSHRPPKSWPENGLITFDRYATRYRKGLDLVVKDISCEVRPNEKVGIVGRTGAGKSSLTLALFRLIEPADGTIFIDGVDISKIGLHDLRGKLTIIPQDPVLFSGTLRLNLDPFNQHKDEKVWDAIDHAHLKEFVSSLSDGLQHKIEEGGENLSVGQRQLVCLARALLRKTKVLILDEATAAVDFETDDLIQQTIRREFSDCTVLTIAHRLNTIMDSTRILVLDKGRIKEFDEPSNLLKDKTSLFYGMAKDAGLL